MKRYKKTYPTIGDLIDAVNYDYDYVSYRIPDEYNDEGDFAGCFRTEKGKIIPLDGDSYGREEPVIASEEWSNPEEEIQRGLTIIVDIDVTKKGKIMDDMQFAKYAINIRKILENINDKESLENLVRNAVAYVESNNNNSKINWMARELFADVISDELIAEIFDA